MDRSNKAPTSANRPMVIVGPGGIAIDKGDLEALLRTEAEELVRQLALEVWRARRRFGRMSADAQEAARPIGDSISRLEDTLTQHEVRFQVHDGEAYDSGLAFEVLEASGVEGSQLITDTVAPTVTWQGRLLSRAQVVVGPAHG